MDKKIDVLKSAVGSWSKKFSLCANDRNLLLEAYRRYHQFARRDGKTISDAWLGLGTPSTYGKSSYFRPLDGKATPRVRNWWLLTDKGVDVVVDLIAALPWDNDYSEIIFTNTF